MRIAVNRSGCLSLVKHSNVAYVLMIVFVKTMCVYISDIRYNRMHA